jgi:hypothetical protein
MPSSSPLTFPITLRDGRGPRTRGDAGGCLLRPETRWLLTRPSGRSSVGRRVDYPIIRGLDRAHRMIVSGVVLMLSSKGPSKAQSAPCFHRRKCQSQHGMREFNTRAGGRSEISMDAGCTRSSCPAWPFLRFCRLIARKRAALSATIARGGKS